MVVTITQTDIPTFPAAEIEQQIRELLADEAQVQATLRGTGGSGEALLQEWQVGLNLTLIHSLPLKPYL